MNKWIEKNINDAYFLRAKLGDLNDCYVDIEVYYIYGKDKDGLLFSKKNNIKYEPTTNLEEVMKVIYGDIKWDGCANLMFSECRDGTMLHFCDPDDLLDFTNALNELYKMAKELMIKADW